MSAISAQTIAASATPVTSGSTIPRAENLLLIADHANAQRDAEKFLQSHGEFGFARCYDALEYSGFYGEFEGVPVIILYQKEQLVSPTGIRLPLVAREEFGAKRFISLVPMERFSSRIGLGSVIVAASAHFASDPVSRQMLRVTADLPNGEISATPDSFILQETVRQLRHASAPYLFGSVLSMPHHYEQLNTQDWSRWDKQDVLASDAITYALYVQARALRLRTVSLGVAIPASHENSTDSFDPSAHLSLATYAALKVFSTLN